MEYVVLKEHPSGSVNIEFGPASRGECMEFYEENLCEYRDNGYELGWMEA